MPGDPKTGGANTASAWLEEAAQHPELVVLGVPLSETSYAQPSGAHLTPAAIRNRMARLASYDSDHDVDLTELAVFDAGDLSPQPSHEQIVEGVRKLSTADMTVFLGGDNAVTYSTVSGLAGDGLGAWGFVMLDAHHDVDPYEGRPGNGSSARALIDAGLPGEQMIQVGIGGFSNSADDRRWCEEQGIEVITSAETRFGGVEDVLYEALDRLGLIVDHIYMNFGLDVLDRAFAPGCAGAHPGGLTPRELLAAAFLSGRHSKVRAIDIVEVDVSADVADITVDVGALCLLSSAAGLHERLH